MAATVRFRIIGGQVTTEIEMPLTDTILNLKESIEERLDVDVARQTIFSINDEELIDQELVNERTIESYDFQQFATLQLAVAPLSSQTKFNILVRSPSKEGNIRVKESYTVDYLKRKIERRWGFLSQNITLIRLSKEMLDHFPLYVYYVCEGSEVEMRINNVEPR